MNWYHGNKTLYPKTYATVVRRSPSGEMVVLADDGRRLTTHIRARNGGRTPTESIQPGVRIKLYRRGDRTNWRRVGR